MDISLVLKRISLVLLGSCMFFTNGQSQESEPPTQDDSQRPIIMLIFNGGSENQFEASDISSLFQTEDAANSGVEEPGITNETMAVSVSDTATAPESIMFPDEIYQKLIEYTIGQDQAMYSLACAIHDHLINVDLRKQQKQKPTDPVFGELELDKQNILMVGPTGCGKTSSLKALSKFLKIPLVTGNATDWTCQGYVGGKWQDVFNDLLLQASASLKAEGKKVTAEAIQEKADQGIIFIDEIDKICTGGDLGVVDRVQQELLPAIQGTVLNLDGGVLDTSNILFVAGGAFPGLLMASDDSDGMPTITPHSLEKYGMLPELAGRLGNIVQFDYLKEADLKKIILQSKNSILAQYIRKYKAAYQIDLSFEPAAIDYIAKVAATYKTGARSINAMLFTLMREYTFNIRQHIGKPLVITKAAAEKALAKFKAKPRSEVKYPSTYI